MSHEPNIYLDAADRLRKIAPTLFGENSEAHAVILTPCSYQTELKFCGVFPHIQQAKNWIGNHRVRMCSFGNYTIVSLWNFKPPTVEVF